MDVSSSGFDVPVTLARASQAELLFAVLDEILGSYGDASERELAILDRLPAFRERLAVARFQLAVVGQFKRGKSSLINKLLGYQVLPTGVLPLTAIATFIAHGPSLGLRVEKIGGAHEEWTVDSIDDLRDRLADFVAETLNPHNCKQVSRVHIALPSPLLADGLVLIDTPGIGSAEAHNTQVAMAALPECDGALVVLSPDPPITEAEIAYTEQVCGHAGLIIPVLNKIDLIAGDDVAASITYLEGVLRRIGVTEPVIVASSRWDAGDAPANPADASAAALVSRLTELDAAKRTEALTTAMCLKIRAALDELMFLNDVALTALAQPLESLGEILGQIEMELAQIESEQSVAFDFLAAERRRQAGQIDGDAVALRRQALGAYGNLLNERGGQSWDQLFAMIADLTEQFFSDAYRMASGIQGERLDQIALGVAARLNPILQHIRQIGADALGVAFTVPRAEVEFAARPSLAWATREADAMNPLPRGWLDPFLPASWHAQRLRRRFDAEIDRLVTLNIERLRWELQQSTVEAIRHFENDIRTAIRSARNSVSGLIEDIRNLKTGKELNLEPAINDRQLRKSMLRRSMDALKRCS